MSKASVGDSASRRRILPKRTKIAFSAGALEEAMVSAASITTMLFYNQVLGVSAALCGTAFFIASVVDGISDPLVGGLSDSVQTRWGRRHPLMFGAAFPLGLCFYLMYQPPDGLSEQGLFWWFTLTMVGVRIAKTFYAVPHAALGAELTDNYDERTSIFGWNGSFMMVGGILISVFLMFVVFPTDGDQNGMLVESRYQTLAILGGVFCFVMVMLCTVGTADQIPFLHAQDQLMKRVKSSYADALQLIWVNIRVLLVNPSYISVVACWLVLAIAGGITSTVGTYALIYAFEFTSEQIAIRDVIRLPGALLCVAVSVYFTRHLDKKYAVIATLAITAFLLGLPYCLRLLGWAPANGSIWLLVVFFSIYFLAFITYPVVSIVIDSQLTDIADEHELQTGNRAEGLIMSIRTFGMKAIWGIGGLLSGFYLEFIDFPENASAATLTQEHIDGLLYMMGPIYYIIIYGGLGFCFMYRINKKRHEEILQELERRRSGESPSL